MISENRESETDRPHYASLCDAHEQYEMYPEMCKPKVGELNETSAVQAEVPKNQSNRRNRRVKSTRDIRQA
jgi:hypothetical protein